MTKDQKKKKKKKKKKKPKWNHKDKTHTHTVFTFSLPLSSLFPFVAWCFTTPPIRTTVDDHGGASLMITVDDHGEWSLWMICGALLVLTHRLMITVELRWLSRRGTERKVSERQERWERGIDKANKILVFLLLLFF